MILNSFRLWLVPYKKNLGYHNAFVAWYSNYTFGCLSLYTFTIILGDEEEWNAGKGYVSHERGY